MYRYPPGDGFPLPFGGRPSLLGSSSSRCGFTFLAVRLLPRQTASGFPCFPIVRCDEGGCLLCPRATVPSRMPHQCFRSSYLLTVGRPLAHAVVLVSHHPTVKGYWGLIRDSLTFTRLVFSLPVAPVMAGRSWAFPSTSHPAVTDSAWEGWGWAVGTRPDQSHWSLTYLDFHVVPSAPFRVGYCPICPVMDSRCLSTGSLRFLGLLFPLRDSALLTVGLLAGGADDAPCSRPHRGCHGPLL